MRGYETDPERLLTGAAELFSADGASLFLASPSGTGFRLAASFGSSTYIPAEASIIEGDGVGGQALSRREPVLISEAGKRSELSSSMVVPLFTGERAIGLLNFSRTGRRPLYNPSDLIRAGAVGAVLSFLFANALMVTEAQVQRARLLAIFELLGIATIIWEQNGSVTGFNAVAKKLVGEPSDVTTALKALPTNVADALRGAEQLVSHGAPAERLRIAAGDKVYGLFVVRLNDGATAWAIEDVTEAEHMQTEFARTQRLAEIGQMTAAIAHDIRNPLTTLIGAGRMIQKDPEMAPEFGKMVEDEAHRLNELCNEFLAFAKPMQIRLEAVDLTQLGTRVVASHQADASIDSVNLSVEAEPNLPTIEADRGRTEQVLHNLVLNAIQACENGGEVRLVITAEGFRVEDTGKGIDEGAMKRLFTPFFTTRAKGTGLGLCNVKRILDAQGARIEVYSLDPGTCFDVTLGGRAGSECETTNLNYGRRTEHSAHFAGCLREGRTRSDGSGKRRGGT